MTRPSAARGLSAGRRATPFLLPIREVAQRLGVTARTLRFYEDTALIGSQRLAGGVRAYDLETITRLRTIIALRDADLSISTIRQILSLHADPVAQSAAAREALAAVLAEKKRQVAHIEGLIAETVRPTDIMTSGAPIARSAEPMIARDEHGGGLSERM